MDMQNVSNLTIPEGGVKAIHNSNNQLLWGRVNYNTKYAGDTFQQTYSGKNLLPIIPDGTYTRNGVTITASNGILTFSGTCSGNADWYIALSQDVVLSAATYTRSENRSQNVSMNTNLSTSGAGWSFNIGYNGASKTQTLTAGTTIHYYELTIINGVNYSGLVIKPQLEKNSSATAYEPYVGGIPAPNPDYPQDVQVVTGAQTVTVSDGTNAQNFTVNLGATELCKIGNYQDYIYKSGDDWYVHKRVVKMSLNGSENWLVATTNGGRYPFGLDVPGRPSGFYGVACDSYAFSESGEYDSAYDDQFTFRGQAAGNRIYFMTPKSAVTGNTPTELVASYKTFVAAHNMVVYHTVITPTDTKITDATLVGQLNAVHEWLTRYGYSATVSGNLPLIVDRTNL